MALAVGAILIGNVYLMFFVVALIGSQAALFGPAKLGSIPEMLQPEQDLVGQRHDRPDDGDRHRGRHGRRQLAVVGASPASMGQERWWLSALVLIGVAMAGWITSLLIMPLKAANPLRDVSRGTWPRKRFAT